MDSLFDSVMLDGADSLRFAEDLTTIAGMIDRAAQVIDAMENAGTPKPDAAWQKCVPSSDTAVQDDGADVVTVVHEIVSDDRARPTEPLTVPRVVA